jgi:CheY-like chemotaxis protein
MARILVIDDEPLIQHAIADMLEDGRHVPIVTPIGAGLLEHLGVVEYDLVVTDLNMPQVNGWDVVNWVRANRPHVPVIAISGRIVAGLDPGWRARFSAVLAKPIDDATLVATVNRLLETEPA